MRDKAMDLSSAIGIMRAPRHLIFGIGQRAVLADHVAALGASALLVTDARMAQDAAFAEMRAAIEAKGVATTVFDGVAAELPVACVADGAQAGAGAEVIVGIGGGSCLDAAKCIALLATHGGQPSDYYGEYLVPGPVKPLIAVPTTAGTGSEVTPVAVVDDPARSLKVGISSPHLVPEVAICDPELTINCPPGLTAASGADALTHAIEAYTALRRENAPRLSLDHVFVGKNVIGDALAIEAIRLIGASLARAVRHGEDLAARSDLILGSTLAGLSFGAAGTAAAHAIQYPVGALTHAAHGVGVATLLPYVMAYNRPACEAEYAEIGTAIGLSNDGSVAQRADRAIAGIGDLLHSIGIPSTLRDLGASPDAANSISDLALGVGRLIKNNPRPVDKAGMADIVRRAFEGDRPGAHKPSREAPSK